MSNYFWNERKVWDTITDITRSYVTLNEDGRFTSVVVFIFIKIEVFLTSLHYKSLWYLKVKIFSFYIEFPV